MSKKLAAKSTKFQKQFSRVTASTDSHGIEEKKAVTQAFEANEKKNLRKESDPMEF